LSGSAGIWGPAAVNSALLAASEINRRGGVLGREIELVFHDAGGDIDDITSNAVEVVETGDADIIMGSHISAVRVALRKVFAGRIPYIYTPVYEGGERTTGPPKTYQAHETANLYFDEPTGKAYAKAFGVSAGWLYLGRGKGPPVDESRRARFDLRTASARPPGTGSGRPTTRGPAARRIPVGRRRRRNRVEPDDAVRA
jgi:hypothetical protein